MSSSFLDAPPEAEPMTDPMSGVSSALGEQSSIMADIRRELLKLNPDVLTETKVVGGNIIDTLAPRRVFFEIGGKPVTVYKVIAWTTQNGTSIALSVGPMANVNDGFILTSSPTVLELPLDNLYLAYSTQGAEIIVNGPSNIATTGGVFIYGFTISDYDRER
jgi:hypothetical protein